MANRRLLIIDNLINKYVGTEVDRHTETDKRIARYTVRCVRRADCGRGLVVDFILSPLFVTSMTSHQVSVSSMVTVPMGPIVILMTMGRMTQ